MRNVLESLVLSRADKALHRMPPYYLICKLKLLYIYVNKLMKIKLISIHFSYAMNITYIWTCGPITLDQPVVHESHISHDVTYDTDK